MTILIESLSFETIIGILDYERRTPQTVVVECRIEYPYTNDAFINYAEVCDHIRTSVQENRFQLLEEALESLGASLKTSFPLIQVLELTLKKPEILPNCTVGVQSRFVF